MSMPAHRMVSAILAAAALGSMALAHGDDPKARSEFDDIYVHGAEVVSYTEGPYAGREIAFR